MNKEKTIINNHEKEAPHGAPNMNQKPKHIGG